jgi:excisionase family DNA binding protein
MDEQISKPLVDKHQLAALLGTHPGHIDRLVRTKKIPHFKVGKFVRFDITAVLDSSERVPLDH